MLVLTRKLTETVVIDGGRVIVSIQEIKEDKVKLGFQASIDVPIHRGEVQELIDAGVPPPLRKKERR